MPVEKAVETTIKILDGLEFLHSRNIIHRDLKPANILLQGETPRLADFGISRALRTTASSQSSNVSGTFAYMSPEGFDGKRSVQTDVWSVGVNLYQLLTGELPYPQKEPSALIAAIMTREFEPLPADVPQNLQNVIAKALAKQSANSYSVAGDMREDLRRVLRGESISDFIQTDSRVAFPTEQVPPRQNTVPFFAQLSQDENETVVRDGPNFGQDKKRKNSNVWMYATLGVVWLASIGLGIYFLANQAKQNDSNKNEIAQGSTTQTNKNSAIAESVNLPRNSNVNFETPTPIPTPDKAQLQKTIKNYVGGIARTRGEKEYNRGKLVFGDLDNDGNQDAAITIYFGPPNGGGGGSNAPTLAVFRNENGQFSFAANEAWGAEQVRYAEVKAIKDGKIYVETTSYSDQDPLCCPSIKGRKVYSLVGNKLAKSK